MNGDRSATRRESFELAGDGALITAAVLAVLTAIVLLTADLTGDREVPVALQIASAAVTLIGAMGGPVAAWFAHRRRASLLAAFGALLGGPLSGAAFFAFVALSTLIGWMLSPVTTVEYAGPLAAAGLAALAFVVLVAWLVFDAVRDLGPARREHRTLDVVRLVSAVVVVAYSAVIVTLALGRAGAELLEALAFMLMGALGGASVVTMADLLCRVAARSKPSAEPAEPG